ncbi:MAG: hypothetical protein JNJ88_14645 [Planctomycetes bacterium]|nr:hypothetical protein [Planctomycetota bacterium]
MNRQTDPLARLDWDALSHEYFEDRRGRFTAAERRRVLETGIAAVAAMERIREAAQIEGARGTTLVVGVGIAEVPLLVAQARSGRRVVAWTRRAREARILAEFCAQGTPAAQLQIVAADAGRAPIPSGIDHLWIVSVLNDPTEFPALHDFYYQRAQPRTFSGSQFDADRRRARALMGRLVARLAPRAMVTLSDDAWPWLEEAAEATKRTIEATERLWRAPLTRDPVRIAVVRR